MQHFLKTNLGKVTTEFFLEQIKQILLFLIFMWVIDFIVLVIPFQLGNRGSTQWLFSLQALQAYMLIIGICYAYGYTGEYVRKGVTRKDYFFGTTLSALGVATIAPILIMIFAGIELAVANTFQISSFFDNAVILGTDTNGFATIIVYMMTVLTYYFIGWLIGIGYYRYDWIIGFGFIALGIIFSFLVEIIWYGYLSTLLISIISSIEGLSFIADVLLGIASNMGDLPMYVSFVGNVILFGVILGVIHIFTKNVVIKVK